MITTTPAGRPLRHAAPVLLALALCAPAPASPPPAVDAELRAVAPDVVSWRRHLHQHPELGNREFETARFIAERLRGFGLGVETGIAHTGVAAWLKGGKPGPTVALRADMDALPVTEQVDLPFASKVRTTYLGVETGVMHACGHDTHVAMLLGVAKVLAGMRDSLAGNVLFIFQPAEEGAPPGEQGGAKLMLAEGLFERYPPDVVFGQHITSILPLGVIGYRSGPLMAAADRFTITVTGRQTHGAAPWKGVDPITTAAQIILGAQTIVSRQLHLSREPAVVSFGKVTGGTRGNIIPDSVELVGTIRNLDMDTRELVHERLRLTAERIAESAGATATLVIDDDGYPVTANDPALTPRALRSLERANPEVRLLEIPKLMGAEDFSWFARQVPGFYYFIGATPPDRDVDSAPPNHSPLFYIDETALAIGTRSLLQLTLDYLEQAEHLPGGFSN